MPLVSALLRSEIGDAVLNPIAASKEIHIALRRDGQVGSGSARDPFDGSTAARFDAVMAALGDGVTVRLGPGTFLTKGERGWSVKNGLKVEGSGLFVTTLSLSLVSAAADEQYHVVGSSQESKNGFELSDLTIDCNLAGQPDTGAGFPQIMTGGVDLRGPNMVIRRVRVINFGTNTKSWECFGIGIAYAAASDTPVASNCVMEDCMVTPPASQSHSAAKLIALRLGNAGTQNAWHTGCVIRNCYVDGGDYPADPAPKLQKDIRGIVASGGKGTIVEDNRILNCQHGGPFQDTNDAIQTWDMMVRGNVFLKVKDGPCLSLPDSRTVERIFVLNNWIELGVSGNARGIFLERSAASGFNNVILRGNVVRYDPQPASLDPTDYGVRLKNCMNAIVENNLVDVGTPDHAVYHESSVSVKPFNNQTNAGAFRPGYDGLTQRHDAELTTDVEDVLLGI